MDLKERLVEGDVSLYSRLSTDNMLADVLRKEMCLLPGLENIIKKNIMKMAETPVNQVRAVGTELRIRNIHNSRPAL